jgi:hypothetical protein
MTYQEIDSYCQGCSAPWYYGPIPGTGELRVLHCEHEARCDLVDRMTGWQ